MIDRPLRSASHRTFLAHRFLSPAVVVRSLAGGKGRIDRKQTEKRKASGKNEQKSMAERFVMHFECHNRVLGASLGPE